MPELPNFWNDLSHLVIPEPERGGSDTYSRGQGCALFTLYVVFVAEKPKEGEQGVNRAFSGRLTAGVSPRTRSAP